MILHAGKREIPAAAGLAAALFGGPAEKLAAEFETLMGSPSCAVFLLILEGHPSGFAQCQLRRDYVEGTESSPVGYLEGIYVCPEFRRQGHARALLAACEQWAGEQGCTEFASDCELDNEASLAFHLKMGFAEANRIICFTKRISHTGPLDE